MQEHFVKRHLSELFILVPEKAKSCVVVLTNENLMKEGAFISTQHYWVTSKSQENTNQTSIQLINDLCCAGSVLLPRQTTGKMANAFVESNSVMELLDCMKIFPGWMFLLRRCNFCSSGNEIISQNAIYVA